ncbi:unnamed protein product [Angiostrongylus costaricensis]|uniref:Uncharacterized protein n=1 Tax=Angiostrongylus costaricensis TaxID=334426 RepID=A0A0R3PNH3_ANGCS|nr:unnamed protein product [Angiostrongylus costaricensis]
MQLLLYLALLVGFSASAENVWYRAFSYLFKRSIILTGEVKDSVAAGYYPSPQPDPSYGYYKPPYNQPPYQPQYYPPHYGGPQYGRPNYDELTFPVAYCSVHASFPLVGAKRYERDYERRHHGRRHRRYERQSCRFTAIFSWESCNTCCRVASRTNGNVYPNEIVGALFVFDPDLDFYHGDDPEEVGVKFYALHFDVFILFGAGRIGTDASQLATGGLWSIDLNPEEEAPFGWSSLNEQCLSIRGGC